MTTQFKEKINFTITQPGQGAVKRVSEDFKTTFGENSVIYDIRVLQLLPNELPSVVKDIIQDASESKLKHLMLFNEVHDTYMINSISETIKSLDVPDNLFSYMVVYENTANIN